MTLPAGVQGHDDDTVLLSLPAQPELWSLARMTARGIATRLDFELEEVEDLALAIDELCSSCASGFPASSRMELSYRWTDHTIEVACILEPRGGKEGAAMHAVEPLGDAGTPTGDLSVDELSARILDALVDEHGIAPAGGHGRSAWLRKRGHLDR
ncbi:MAG TPA: hypothetical protein VKT18_09150 [Acidimicrobiales bacterium]|nr:hypothetical protein [Acidimicrobiales bacterium]